MKCPKCGYTSFDYLDDCGRCGSDLRDVRTLLQIIAVSPEERAPAAAAGAPAAVAAAEHEAPSSDLAGEKAPPEDLFEDMDFDGSFDDMVERTQYDTEAQEKGPASTTAEAEDELLDLDFGELFGEKEKSSDG